jgi:hypothetical protein
MKASGARAIHTLGFRCLPWVLMVGFLCGVSFARVSLTEQHHEKSQAASDNSESRHFFFGTSPDAKLGTLAWLFYIDKEHHTGQIFVAPRMIEFSEFTLGEDGTLTFQSLDFFGKEYRFNGTLKSEGITGDMQLIDAKAGNPKGKWQLTATQLSPQNPRPGQTLSPERYSNIDYSAEGGDFTGADIRFFSTGMGMTGMIVFYESYWGEPTFTPIALSKIETGKNVIKFEVEMPNGVARYHLRLTATGGLFNRDDVAHEKGEKDIVLKKSRSVLTAPLGRKE